MLSSDAERTAGVYAQKARRHSAARDVEMRRSAIIARLRLATFLPGAGVLGWAFARGVTPERLILAAVLLAIFGVLVAWHAIVENRVAWHEALRDVCERGVAREARDWSALPPGDPPDGVDLSGHPYAIDLDVFGRASLFQWLGPAATVSGSERLESWLLTPAPPEEIVDRQQAVAALAPLDDWRERFAAHGIIASGPRSRDIDRFLTWAEGTIPPFGGGYVYGMALTLTIAIWVLIALNVTVVDAAFWLTPILLGIILSFVFSIRVTTTLELAGGGQRGLARYGALLEHAVSASTSSPAAGDAAAAALVRRGVGARMHAAAQSDPRLRRRPQGRCDLPLSDSGAHALGLSRPLRAGALATPKWPPRQGLAGRAG